MRRVALLLAGLIAACGPLTPPGHDAGPGGGAGGALGGSTGTGGGGATGGGGGVAGGGGGAIDGGTWQFSSVTITPAPANFGSVVGFAETDGGIYAVAESGRVFRSTGGAFTELFVLPSRPNDFQGSPDGQLFATANRTFFHCAAGCDQLVNWSYVAPGTSSDTLSALCLVSSSHVLALGGRGNGYDGVAFRWNGSTLDTGGTSFGVTYPEACVRMPTGDFLIPGHGAAARYDPLLESFGVELPASDVKWFGAGFIGTRQFLAGLGPRISQRVDGAWTNVFGAATSGGNLRVIIGTSAGEGFAFGGGPSSSGQAGYRFDGITWTAMNPDLPAALNVASSALLTSDGTLYVGGNDSNLNAVILRGVRR